MRIFAALIFLSVSLVSFAGEEEVKGSSIRFIALGERTVRGEELPLYRNPYEFPPCPVIVSDALELRDEVPILLNRISPPVRFDAGTEVLKLWEKRDSVEGPWLEVKSLDSPRSLGVIYLDQPKAETTWEKPKLLVVDDTPEAFPAGEIRFVNTTDKIAVIRLSDAKPFGLAPGKSCHKTVKDGKCRLKVGYRAPDGSAKSIWQNTITLKKGERIQSFFFQRRGNSSRAVRFLNFKEAVPVEGAVVTE